MKKQFRRHLYPIWLAIHKVKATFLDRYLASLQREGLLKKSYPEQYKEWNSKRMSAVSRGGELPLSYQDFRFWLYLRKCEEGFF